MTRPTKRRRLRDTDGSSCGDAVQDDAEVLHILRRLHAAPSVRAVFRTVRRDLTTAQIEKLVAFAPPRVKKAVQRELEADPNRPRTRVQPDATLKARQRRWFDAVVSSQEVMLLGLYPGADGARAIADWLLYVHERHPYPAKRPVRWRVSRETFLELVEAKVREAVRTSGATGWTESATHSPSPRKGRPVAATRRTGPLDPRQWNEAMVSSLLAVARYAAALASRETAQGINALGGVTRSAASREQAAQKARIAAAVAMLSRTLNSAKKPP